MKTHTDLSIGFLWQRQPPRSCQVDLLLPNGDYAEMFVSESVFEEDSRPLDNRGWAFQESTLSPRLLIYGTMDVSWRCSTQTFQTICGAVNERFIPTPRSLPELFDDRLSRPAEKGQNQAWRNLMVDYTPRSLTFPSDRLSAIAGVAAEFGKLFNDEYLAGMWRKTLRTDLGWYRSDREGYMKCQNFGLGLAPSWSWAKIEQGFIDNNAITDPDIEVIRTEIEWLPIQNGTIAAKGCLHVRGIIINMSDIVRNRPIGFEQFMDEENGAASSDAKCLYLGSTFGPHKAIGLLIEPVDGSKYRRVGRVSIQAERTSPLSEKFFSIWGQPGARTETIVLI